MASVHPRATWLDPDTGSLIDHHELMQQMAKRQVVLLGETHDVSEIHRWQMHVIAALYTLRKNIMVGFEMFPRRLQPVLDEWVRGELSTKEFIKKSEWADVWGFPEDLYLPIFHYCRQNKIRMLAVNCPRALVKRIGQEGWENVPEDERDGLTPAAPPTEEYIASLRRWLGTPEKPWEPTERFFRAQQTWDRSFACNMVYAIDEARERLQKDGEKVSPQDLPLVVGVIGRGHMMYKQGMVYQLKDLGIDDVGVLLPSEQAEFDTEKMHGVADAVYRIDTPDPEEAASNKERVSKMIERYNKQMAKS